MAYKQFNLEGVGPLTIYKRRGSRSMRLSVTADGSIRMTMPTYVPYQAGLAFAESRRAWLINQAAGRSQLLENGQAIGKKHRLLMNISFQVERPAARLKQNDIVVTFPASMAASEPAVQAAAVKACVRALRDEAEEMLPGRLAELANAHDFQFKSVSVKRLKGRWGSCDQSGNIVLNLYLMQLPWELIDYVLIHELVHTKHLHHGPDFWASFLSHLPDAKLRRTQIRRYQPNFGLPLA
jgi:predicted metal-dependent hydrolase